MDSNLKAPPVRTKDRLWPLGLATFLSVMLLTGGTSQPSDMMVYLHAGLSVPVLAIALTRLAWRGLPSRLAFYGTWLAVLIALVPLLQLMPLPPQIWQQLPTHAIALQNMTLTGVPASSMTLSLSPEVTRLDTLALLPALALFFGTLTVPLRQLSSAGTVVLACAVIALGFGLGQVSQGEQSALYLYGSETNIATGTFGNRSFFAAFLYSSIVFTGLAGALLRQKRKWPGWLAGLFAGGLVAVLLVGIALSGSRMGLLLAVPAILFALLALYGGVAALNVKTVTVAVFVLLAAVFVVGQSSMLGLLRLAGSDPFSDERATVLLTSLSMLRNALPFGTGFGSFVPLYQAQETPAMLHPEYINHVHNDWLELVLEGGLIALVLEVLFVIWLAVAFIRVWRYGRGHSTAVFQRAATLVVPLLLIHSAVDFPLRTPALMSLFALCCAMMTLPPDVQASSGPSRGSRSRPAPRAVEPPSAPAPFRRPQSPFGLKPE